VPYHALPLLHKEVKDDCPVPYSGIIEAFREIIPALIKQSKDVTYYVERKLPESRKNIVTGKMNIYTGKEDSLVNGKITVCRIDELPKGEVLRFDFQQRTYAVYRTINNEFSASDGFCTHGNAHLAEGAVIGDIIECHKHNGRFSIKDGTPKRMPATIGLRTYKVEASDEKVVLDLSAINGNVSEIEESEKTFSVVSNRNITPFIREVILSPLDGTRFNFLPGQYVQMKIPPYKVGFKEFQIEEPFRKVWDKMGMFDFTAENTIYSKRNYSLANNPSTDAFIKLIVRIVLPPAGSMVTAGAGSSYVFNLKQGDEVQITGPFGDFLLKDSSREIIYLGGGAGMAPLRSHLSYLFETVHTTRKVSFWYGARSSEDLFYQEYFEKLEADNPNFSFHVSLSEPKPEDRNKFNTGFIHEYLLNNYLASHNQSGEIEYYLCGPPAMIEASLKMLKNLEVPDDLIAFDEF